MELWAAIKTKRHSLKGSNAKDFRRTKKEMGEAGVRFEVVPARNVPPLLPTLRTISDAWLGNKSTAEKGISLGFFSERYLLNYDMAIVQNRDNEPIAFANLWRGAQKYELSVDLMRYLPNALYGIMEYLFVEAMLLGKE